MDSQLTSKPYKISISETENFSWINFQQKKLQPKKEKKGLWKKPYKISISETISET